VCSHALGIDRERAALSFLYGFVVSVVGAALRLGVIQHLEGQEIIHELKPEVIGAIRESMDVPASEIWQFSPHLDICQMRHEKMDSRMFIT
jgi:urease accessory protein